MNNLEFGDVAFHRDFIAIRVDGDRRLRKVVLGGFGWLSKE